SKAWQRSVRACSSGAGFAAGAAFSSFFSPAVFKRSTWRDMNSSASASSITVGLRLKASCQARATWRTGWSPASCCRRRAKRAAWSRTNWLFIIISDCVATVEDWRRSLDRRQLQNHLKLYCKENTRSVLLVITPRTSDRTVIESLPRQLLFKTWEEICSKLIEINRGA